MSNIEAALKQLFGTMAEGQTPEKLADKIVDMLNDSGFDAADQLETMSRVNSMLALSLVTNQASREMTGQVDSDLSNVLNSMGAFVGEMSRKILEENKADVLRSAVSRAMEWFEDDHCDCDPCNERARMLRRNIPVLRAQLAEAETTH
ncbi:hypothetical protein [Alteromonas phage ZP6]|uniref:Uncharacterized protein n=1 Tax=Alteromonas phage ZP6 TaxID=2492447 RepID=A0A3S9U885_9CAUD|nr:hypothetical protein PQC03_gp38 [Alteromonas phage ZP6]AZS06541.1 hypothetical protein [Alteromonas phage ZP6]